MAQSMTLDPGKLVGQLRRAERRKRAFAISLTLPLLLFLLFTFLVPIGALLVRAVENPEVANTLGHTAKALSSWSRTAAPPAVAYAALIEDLSAIKEQSDAGALARRLNSEVSGARSLIMSTYRALPLAPGMTPEQVRTQLLALDARWGELSYWQAIAKNASRWTPDYLLTSLDLKRDVQGHITQVDADSAAFANILVRTFKISAIVTLFCLLLGYPLAYWLSILSTRKANMLMILVLVPFWTSILVRVAAWIVLLQSNGLVNRSLMGLGLTDAPLPLLFNRLGVIIAMVHILLPFMILPLYSVMKSVPPTYLRAAVSLGSHPLAAFFRVYVPQTWPGVGAGGLLVFILSIGYYVTPALLGGAGDQMLSYYIAQYTNVNVNWGMACALGAVLLTATLVLYALYRRVVKSELSLG
ncbi:binding-protein-dependent transport systems inner membrane component [Rhodoferax ferrireducens T118]|uniref:Binding-protein-dependent transport systems inner membrane component n=1 Tax=Albidiferax ferrireducens (strain ATCC BAA-621 / DSM 15236 / T118) TaxID=338969 RepID=Q221F7_ALBFT|nr:ABC transporter permease [Rhodoferax ferrireducens]ABD68346.1 binding-protein-dependent transport systems inner membrane component [Rhodoferax ferrireducens T118]